MLEPKKGYRHLVVFFFLLIIKRLEVQVFFSAGGGHLFFSTNRSTGFLLDGVSAWSVAVWALFHIKKHTCKRLTNHTIICSYSLRENVPIGPCVETRWVKLLWKQTDGIFVTQLHESSASGGVGNNLLFKTLLLKVDAVVTKIIQHLHIINSCSSVRSCGSTTSFTHSD